MNPGYEHTVMTGIQLSGSSFRRDLRRNPWGLL